MKYYIVKYSPLTNEGHMIGLLIPTVYFKLKIKNVLDAVALCSRDVELKCVC